MEENTVLSEERSYYEESLPDWLTKYAGRVVLVKGRELIGVYNTDEEALTVGAQKFGLTPFLVRRVEPVRQEVSIPALTLGILRADIPYADPRPGCPA